MRAILLKTEAMIWTWKLWLLLFVIMSIATHDWSWFGRSGPILVLLGAAIGLRRAIRLGPEALFSGFARDEESQRDVAAVRASVLPLVLGILVWGYGDLAVSSDDAVIRVNVPGHGSGKGHSTRFGRAFNKLLEPSDGDKKSE